MDRTSIKQYQVSIRGRIAIAPGSNGCDQGNQAQQPTGEGDEVPGKVIGYCFILNKNNIRIVTNFRKVEF